MTETAIAPRAGWNKVRLLAVPIVFILALIVGGYFVLAPRDHIPLPSETATPEQVVEAYIDAINARDYKTSNAMFPGAAGAPRGLFSGYEHIDLKSIDRVDGDKIDHAWVHFTAEFSGGDGSLNDTTVWGYILDRASDGRWVITSQGVV